MKYNTEDVRMLEMDRLYLRNLVPSDLDSIYDYRNNEECNRYQRWDAFTADDIKLFIDRFKNDEFLSTKQEQHFAICLKSTSELVGELAYFYTPDDCITLGISISYHYHKNGFAFETLTKVIALIRDKYPSMDIVGLIEKENIKSIKLFEKLGFEQECYAESISSYVYVIYAEALNSAKEINQMIIKDSKGNELRDIITISEKEAEEKYSNITHALAVVKVGNDYLLGWNHWRKKWEIFGGCKESGESIRECIIRECKEELGIEGKDYTYLGLMYYKMAPGYFNPEWHEEYGALYGITLPESAMGEINCNRADKEEIERLAFYSQVKGVEPIAEIDEKLLEYWK